MPILSPLPHWTPRVEKGSFSLLHWLQNLKKERKNKLLKDAIMECLPHLRNVTSLTIRDSDLLKMALNPLAKEVLSAVTLPFLNTLAIYGRINGPDYHHVACCHQFFDITRLQPLLEHILLFCVGTGWDLQQHILPTDLPRLSTLVAGINEANALVPGRSITSLVLIGIWPSRIEATLAALTPSACLPTKLTLDLGRFSYLFYAWLRPICKISRASLSLLAIATTYLCIPPTSHSAHHNLG
ncbi:hypothetical protein FRB95_004796 [Tulasnella sp. JGI-2019a]|nr:hypothetical protein FRB95_004796 [Tulasnella sp. JGI-2019a]